MKKANPTGLKTYSKYSTLVQYEYKGYKYDVEYSNAISYCVTSPKIQHDDAQRRIDEMIENRKQHTGENAQKGFDLFWEYVEGN